MFDRFWRGDSAKTDMDRHCGLGLSLCQRLIELRGGKVSLIQGRGANCRLHLIRRGHNQTFVVNMTE